MAKMKMTDLDSLIPQYFTVNSELTVIKNHRDKINTDIKDIMRDYVLPNYIADGYKATLSISDTVTMDEDILLDILHKHPTIAFFCVKTKEYVDFDALESLIYKGEIGEDILLEMDKAKKTTTKETLRVTKVKKGEKDNG